MRALSQTPSVACSHQWERYRSGHNGTDSKSVGGITPHVGSNPTLSAKQRAPRQRGFLFGGAGGVDEPTGSTIRQDRRIGRRSKAEAPRSGEGQKVLLPICHPYGEAYEAGRLRVCRLPN